jgi:NADPH:quinone reductase-like Zn-dependent oxidoreductase
VKAVVCDRYGPPDVLRLAEVERPVPAANEVLVKVHATTVTRSDAHTRAGKPLVGRLFYGLRRPKWRILGLELAGEVAEAGAAVTEFTAGDEVFGENAGLGKGAFGAHAEYICMRETAPLAHKPRGMSFEQAAAVCDGAILALGPLNAAGVGKGQRILIYGASGSIGTAAVQLAKYFDADVTAVCNTKNVETVRSLGADQVIDYTREDFTKNGQAYDVIFDAVGKHSFWRCRGSLKRGGIYLPTDGFLNILVLPWLTRIGTKRVVIRIPPRFTKEEVRFVKRLIEEGRYRAVIDRCYPLEDVVEATRYVETQQKTGNVVLTV